MILKVSTAYKNIIAYKYNVRVWPNVEFFFLIEMLISQFLFTLFNI